MKLLTSALANKHTSIAGVIYLLAKFGAELGAVWVPNHAEQFRQTANVVEACAVAYGLLAAGDASKSVTKEQADTTFVKKPDAPPLKP